MGGVLVQFKKFAMAATQRMLLRGMQERDLSFLEEYFYYVRFPR